MQVGWCGHWNPLLLGGGSARFVLLRSLAVDVREEHTGYQGSTCVNKFVCCESPLELETPAARMPTSVVVEPLSWGFLGMQLFPNSLALHEDLHTTFF